MISNEAALTAGQCRHYSMCKIDYLGTGLCPAGAENLCCQKSASERFN